MNSERDAQLEALFADANSELSEETFTASVMRRIDRMRRAALFGWVCLALGLLIGVGLLAEPAMQAIDLMVRFLPQSWFDIENHGAAVLLAPINSIGAVVALVVLGLYRFFRKFF